MYSPFYGVITAIITPFTDKIKIGESDKSTTIKYPLDIDTFKSLIETQIAASVSGIIIGGSTGEGMSLTNEEYKELFNIANTVRAEHNSKINLIGCINANVTHLAIEQANIMDSYCLDGVMITCPYYNKPSQVGLIAHFTSIANAIKNTPIMIYNIPGRAVISIELDTVETLFKVSNIVAIKDSTSDVTRLISSTSRFGSKVLCGDDDAFIPFMSMSAGGIVSVISNIFPRCMVELFHHCENNNYSAAVRLFNGLKVYIDWLGSLCNPIGIKSLMAMNGLIQNCLREPLIGVKLDMQNAIINNCVDSVNSHNKTKNNQKSEALLRQSESQNLEIHVLKIGGSVLGSYENLPMNLPRVLAAVNQYKGKKIIILSALAGETRKLLTLSESLMLKNNHKDEIFSIGEISACKIVFNYFIQAGQNVGLLSSEATIPVITDDNFGEASIIFIDTEKITRHLQMHDIVIIPGFIGQTSSGRMTTMEFEGSDITAVEIAKHMECSSCTFFKDVGGIYDKDPNKTILGDKEPSILEKASYKEVICLLENGAQVLHKKAVLSAQQHKIELIIRGLQGDLKTIISE
jgi:4-hydroxy-tetrahydrodipicolinate synthase